VLTLFLILRRLGLKVKMCPRYLREIKRAGGETRPGCGFFVFLTRGGA
jgi:hypothetical protein